MSCAIENAVSDLQQEIESKKMRMQQARDAQPNGPSLTSHLFSEIFKKSGQSYLQLSGMMDHGVEFAQGFLKKAKDTVEENPWDAVRKVAMSSFAIGLFLSRRHKKTPHPNEEKA